MTRHNTPTLFATLLLCVALTACGDADGGDDSNQPRCASDTDACLVRVAPGLTADDTTSERGARRHPHHVDMSSRTRSQPPSREPVTLTRCSSAGDPISCHESPQATVHRSARRRGRRWRGGLKRE